MAASIAAARPLPRAPTALRRELVVGAAALSALVATFVLAPISAPSTQSVRLEAGARVLLAAIPVCVAIYSWRVVPFGRYSTLLVLSSLIWLVATFSLTDGAFAYSVGRVAAWIGWVTLVYLMLAFPEGALTTRLDRGLVAVFALILLVLWLPTALLVDHYPAPSAWVTCASGCPHNAFMVVSHEPGVVGQVVTPLREVLTVLLFLAVVSRLLGRIESASRVRRRTLTPVLALASAGIALTATGLVLRRIDPGSSILVLTRWLVAFALPALALGVLVGLLRWRLYVSSSLSRFAASRDPRPGPDGVRAAFAAAFEDPSLEIVYPVAVDRWAGADGHSVQAPVAGRGQSVTELRDASDNVVAALIHDEALKGEEAFINTVGSYASLTLENQRLAADVADLAKEMREAHVRAAASEDRTRQEIERDLHDGAQQRLIALQFKLELAAEHAGLQTAAAEEFNELAAEIQLVMNELRALARGVFNPVLTDLGPVAALRAAVRTAPIPTTIAAFRLARESPEIERAVYFCCLEALQNVYKHARGATAAQVTISARRHMVLFGVSNDGDGFVVDAVRSGAGLHNMHDRVASVGGSLRIESSAGVGTHISGVIPIAPMKKDA